MEMAFIQFSNCLDKLDLIEQMITANSVNMTQQDVLTIFNLLNDASHLIDEYIDRHGIRDREIKPKTEKK
jgi:hypothetical protein